MQIHNKFEKLLLTISGFFLLALVVMGFKLQENNKKLTVLANLLDPQADSGMAVQDAIQSNRNNKLNIAAHAPLTNSNTQTTIKTVIPGKIITQTVPVSSSKTSASLSNTKTKSS